MNIPTVDAVKLFAFYKLNQTGQDKAKQMADAFHSFYCELHNLTFGDASSTQPNWEGREWAIAKTKLEEACFFAKKSMATQAANQDVTQ